MSTNRPRWFGATPLDYIPGPTGFWFRDLGALTQEFLRTGVDSKFVALGSQAKMEAGKPLILCSREEMASTDWWKSHNVDGVVLNSWGAPRFTPIARAIKFAGARLIIRLDTDGIKSPRTDFKRYLSSAYLGARDGGTRFPAASALCKSIAFRLFPQIHDLKFFDHLELADAVLVESLPAKRYIERLAKTHGRSPAIRKLHVLPHFAAVEKGCDPALPKKSQILAVGRWDATQKDGASLIRALGRALEARSDYTAKVVGSGRDYIEPFYRELPESIQRRLVLVGLQTHEQVQQHCRESRIIFFSSRFEGFPFAASEALCCGCTVVGSVTLPSMSHIATCGGGTVALSRSVTNLADALVVEVDAWETGWRDAESISTKWMSEISLKSVAKKILELGKIKRKQE